MIIPGLRQVSRSLWRYKSFSLINILGLAIGIAALTLLLLLADYENRFDDLHRNGDEIFRVVSKKDRSNDHPFQAAVPYPLASLLRTELPGIKTTEIHYAAEMSLRIGKAQAFIEKNVVFADSSFFNVFDYSKVTGFWVRGSQTKFQEQPDKAIVTEKFAEQYFHNDDPVGRTIMLDNKKEVEVVAVVKDIPATTHLPVNLFVTFSTLDKNFVAGLDPQHWGVRSNGYCYLRLPEGTATVNSVLAKLVAREADGEDDKKQVMSLQGVKDIHFNTSFESSNPSYTITSNYVGLLVLLGGFILLVACINYVNLSTSLALAKSKDVGIRKTVGASRGQLFVHYLFETFVLTCIAALLGLLIATVCLPAFNSLMQKSVSLYQAVYFPYAIAALVALIVISFLSGFYPALVLSGFKPIESLKTATAIPGRSSSLLRKSLVAFQFMVSTGLIICTIVFSQQTKYFQTKSLGFNKESVVEVKLPSNDSAKMIAFKSALANKAGIRDLSLCLGAPISDNGVGTGFYTADKPGQIHNIKLLPADHNYLTTYGIKLAAGRWFLPGEPVYKDSATAIVVNESLVKALGYTDPSEAIGKKITIGVNDLDLPIIGVTKDFHTSSLHDAISPVGIMPFSFFYYAAAIRIQAGAIGQTLPVVEKAWRQTYPDDVYSFNFIDETLAKLYERETRDYNLFKAFSGVSIFICCIGLWGLIAFIIVRKTKEIGIRKVLGANVAGIVALLSKDFLRLAIIGLCIATPVVWYFMNKWLENFTYRVDISWWIFPLAGFIAIFIAFLTISFQAVKAALANPVDSLRNE